MDYVINDLNIFENNNILYEKEIHDNVILDWECGSGLYSAVFVERGAKCIYSIDTWLDLDQFSKFPGNIPIIQYDRISIEDFSIKERLDEKIDIIFANTVTEHMINLPVLLLIVTNYYNREDSSSLITIIITNQQDLMITDFYFMD